MNLKAMSLCCRALLAVVFIIACYHKILYPYDFARVISKYELLPDAAINGFALALPVIELLLALALLLIKPLREAAAWGLGLLLVLFIGAISIKLAQGAEIHCGCFTSSAAAGTAIGPENIMRNIGLLTLCAFVIFVERGFGKPVQEKSN